MVNERDVILGMHNALRARTIDKLPANYLPHLSRVSQLYLMAHPTYVMTAPGLWSGERYRQQPEVSRVPSESLMDSILFAGQGDFSGLEKATYDQLSSWSDRTTSWDENQTDTSKPLRFRIDNIFRALNFVERHMADEKRGTGEPGVAHQYRTVLQALDLVSYTSFLRVQGKNMFSFSPETAEQFILMNVLHDFVEKEEKPKYDERGNKVETRIEPYYPYPHDPSRESGLYLQRYSVPVGVQDKDKYSDAYLTDETHLDIAGRYMHSFVRGIEALDSTGLDGKEAIDRVTAMMSSSRVDEAEFLNIMMWMMPRIVKCLDRLDNLRTRTFEINPYYIAEDQTSGLPHISRDAEGIIKKARETLEAFPSLETGLTYLGYSRKMTIPTALYIAGTGNFIHTGTMDSYLASLRPTRWAIYTLAGLSPDEIWESYPSRLGPSIPRLR